MKRRIKKKLFVAKDYVRALQLNKIPIQASVTPSLSS